MLFSSVFSHVERFFTVCLKTIAKNTKSTYNGKITKESDIMKKKTSVSLKNDMRQLAAGIVPSNDAGGRRSANEINSTKPLSAQIRHEFITTNYVLLSYLYQQFGWIQSIIEVPVLDAFRGGVQISAYERKVVVPEKKRRGFFSFWNADDGKKSSPAPDPKADASAKLGAQQEFMDKQLERREQWERDQNKKDEQLKKADDTYLREEVSKEEVRMVEIYLRRGEIWKKFQQALFWSRLYGGAGIIVLDGRKPSFPLKLEDINKDTELEFVVCDNWQLSGTPQTNNGTNTVDWLSDTPFTVCGHPVHKSRVILLKNKDFPPLYRAVGRGWGMSAMEPLVRTLNKSIKNENVIFELLDEAKMDVFKFYGFNDSMQDEDATSAITKRVAFAQQTKNYLGGILLDSEDGYDQKQIHFNGLADLKIDARVDVASDAHITMNKLYGTSPAGFNSGEADRETYADMVEAEVRIPSESAMIRILEIIGRKVLGKTLDFDIQWNSLIRTSKYEEMKQKTLMLANLNEANMWGRITNKEWQDAVNKYDLLGIEVSYKERFVADPMAKNVFKPGFGNN